MSLDNGLTSAFTAAIAHLEKCAGLTDLAKIRVAKLKKEYNFVVREPSCRCVDPRGPNSTRRLVPLIEVQSASEDGKRALYKALGVVFLSWQIPGAYLPYIEMMELPLVLPGSDKPRELIEWDAELQSFYSPMPLSAQLLRQSSALSEELVWKVRHRALRECFDASKQFGYINLSVLTPPDLVQLQEDVDAYLAASRSSLNVAPFDERPVRIVVQRQNSRLYSFELRNFAVTSRELTRAQF